MYINIYNKYKGGVILVRTGRPVSNDSKKTSVNIRVTEEQREKLKIRALEKGLNLSEYVLYACEKEMSDKVVK